MKQLVQDHLRKSNWLLLAISLLMLITSGTFLLTQGKKIYAYWTDQPTPLGV